jgi:hypothetical protein
MFPCCHIQGAAHFFAGYLKRLWYQQMSCAGDRPGGRDVRLPCNRGCDDEREQEGLAESTAACRASSSTQAVKVQMSSPDEGRTRD